MTDSIENRLKVLQDQVAICTKCDLCKTRTKTVFARGNPHAYIVICGEGPGEEEDKTGLPFVGRSGQLLDKILTEMGLNVAQDIYVCNIIKCRPPGNRRPSEDEVNECIGYLEEQLEIVSPKVIVALGNTAISGLLPVTYGVSKIRGTFFKRGKMLVVPTYHPSYLLRNNNPASEPHVQFRSDISLAISKTKENV